MWGCQFLHGQYDEVGLTFLGHGTGKCVRSERGDEVGQRLRARLLLKITSRPALRV